jgi:hypothetical protein
MKQDKDSGSRAAKYGLAGAVAVAEKIGAKRVSSRSNEFELDGERITIRMAHIGNHQVGTLYEMLKRVKTVIGAFEIAPNEYELLSLSSDIYRKPQHMRDSKGRVGLVRKKIFIDHGKSVATVKLRV